MRSPRPSPHPSYPVIGEFGIRGGFSAARARRACLPCDLGLRVSAMAAALVLRRGPARSVKVRRSLPLRGPGRARRRPGLRTPPAGRSGLGRHLGEMAPCAAPPWPGPGHLGSCGQVCTFPGRVRCALAQRENRCPTVTYATRTAPVRTVPLFSREPDNHGKFWAVVSCTSGLSETGH